MKTAECHPGRRHHAKGLCQPCYEQTPSRQAKKRASQQTLEYKARKLVRGQTPKAKAKKSAARKARKAA